MTKAVIALGGNIGESQSILRDAINAISELPHTKLEAVSNLYETDPIGGPEQPKYLNAAVLVSTQLAPAELLSELHEIENIYGRTRDIHWGPRTLDLDLIDFEGFVANDPELTIPHPRAHDREFVLAPWADVAPDWKITVPDFPESTTVAQQLAAVKSQGQGIRQASNLDDRQWWAQ